MDCSISSRSIVYWEPNHWRNSKMHAESKARLRANAQHFQVLALLRWISRLGGVIYLSSHGHGETILANQVWRVCANRSSAMCSKTLLKLTRLAMYPGGILSHFCCDTITASMSCRHQNCLSARMCKRGLCARQARSDRAMLASSRSAESQNQNTLPFFQS